MLYRVRRYVAIPERLSAFHEFFHAHLLPIQVRHGARLIGRWEVEGREVIAIWEYDDQAAYERIDAAVRDDPASRTAQERRHAGEPFFTEMHESFARCTVQGACRHS